MLCYYIKITWVLGSRLKAKPKTRLKCFEMFQNVRRTCFNIYVEELEQKLNERVLPPVLVPSSKEDIDLLANKVHSVITKSYEAACPMRKSLCKKDNIWWNSELASLRKEVRRTWRKVLKKKRRLGGSKARPSLFQKSCHKSKPDHGIIL